MPEFIPVSMQQCSTLELRGAQIGKYSLVQISDDWEDWICNCPSYKFSKPPKGCKHIDRHLEERCTWHEMFGKSQTEEEREQMVCPECGKETVWRNVGV